MTVAIPRSRPVNRQDAHQHAPTPLLFVNKTSKNYKNARQDAARVASHVVSKYRPWKRNKATLYLDKTTKAILNIYEQRRNEGPPNSTPSPKRALRANDVDVVADTPTTTQSVISTPAQSPSLPPSSSPSVIVSTHPTPGDDFFEDLDQASRIRPQSAVNATENDSGAIICAGRLLEDHLAPRINLLGYHGLDPFSNYGCEMDEEMRSNLHFYFTVIRPFATNLLDAWWWCDSAPQVQSSRVLAYAVGAFASIFLSGCLRGGPGVVLPPPVEPGGQSRWPNPPWLRLQTMCLSYLNVQLQNLDGIDDSCFAAMLFLFRISVLLADGHSGRIHARALRKLGASLSSIKLDLNMELAVARVNIISAFAHRNTTVVIRQRPRHRRNELAHVVGLDDQAWELQRDWHAMRGSLAGRTLAWRDEEPASSLQQHTVADLLLIDPGRIRLPQQVQTELQLCYQIALFLTHVLHCVSFNTAAPRIRSNAMLLKDTLSTIDAPIARQSCPNVLFWVLMTGAIACHSYVERLWFVSNLSNHFPEVHSMNAVVERIANVYDPLSLIGNLVEEVWFEVLKFRGVQDLSHRTCLWEGPPSWKIGTGKAFRDRHSAHLTQFRRIAIDAQMVADVKAEFD